MDGSAMKLPLCVISQMFMNFVICGTSWCSTPPNLTTDVRFEQKTNRFWEFEKDTNRWVEVNLPFDLMSCINDSCTRVGSIQRKEKEENSKMDRDKVSEENNDQDLPLRKRVSLTKMFEASVWVTGQSGSIFERFWNGVQWVIAPHELPAFDGQAVSVFIANQTILALSEMGKLYQLLLDENSQPIWREVLLQLEPELKEQVEANPTVQIKSGVVSSNGELLYMCSSYGSLLEIAHVQPLSWTHFGRPPGGDVSAIADAGSVWPGVVFTISSTGELYEFDKKTKPSWKKHIWSELQMKETALKPTGGCTLNGLFGAHSLSLFLLTKDGFLIERRLHRRKWSWTEHGAPLEYRLSAITPVHNDNSKRIKSLFFTTTTGFVFEYQLSRQTGPVRGNQPEGIWVNHMHPHQAKVAQGVQGVELQNGRIIFALEDGRLGELHFPGVGGEGPYQNQMISRRKGTNRYLWSIIDVPETEGWNAEYCTEERGPTNCIVGLKDANVNDQIIDMSTSTPARRVKAQEHEPYILLNNHESGTTEPNNFLTTSINSHFHMRVMHADRSFFLITENGLTFEYMFADSAWLWLRHEHSVQMKGVIGSYQGSLFLVDTYGSLLIRERDLNELSWINCTAMRKGKQISTGPPWDSTPGKTQRSTSEDSIFFVSKKGRLLQFTVALRKFKWKDCRNPPDTKIAFIVDQETFRMNIVFVVGRNGQLYQYNKVTELWHKHHQSPHIVISRSPGTAMRRSLTTLSGSIFMILESGGLIEYHWNPLDGWEWIEHGTPYKDVKLVGAPGPCFDGTQLFVIGSDGNVYRRHLNQRIWAWTNHGYPYIHYKASDIQKSVAEDSSCAAESGVDKYGNDIYGMNSDNEVCDEKVASTRPISFSEDSVIFELRDGRLGELRRSDSEAEWEWTRIIGTPTSPCLTSYWTAVAS